MSRPLKGTSHSDLPITNGTRTKVYHRWHEGDAGGSGRKPMRVSHYISMRLKSASKGQGYVIREPIMLEFSLPCPSFPKEKI